jgi:hypothetical protein
MKAIRFTLILFFNLSLAPVAQIANAKNETPLAMAKEKSSPANTKEKGPLEVVRHTTRVKILESNNVTLRPGSVYDNITLFELYFGARPQFTYQFIDTGLGAAEPLYPNLQVGYQKSWAQLLPAFFSEKNRHIDHFTSITTPEGCKVDSAYLLRHISEYPEDVFTEERSAGYQMVVVRFEHYTRPAPTIVCGRHKANDPDPQFDPMKTMKKWAKMKKVSSLTQFPKELVDRFEAKISVIYHIDEERNKNKWPRIDKSNQIENSLWYYPHGREEDYGHNTKYRIGDLQWLNQPKHLVIDASEHLQSVVPFSRLISSENFSKLLLFLNGQPTPDFNESSEPGRDTFKLSQVTNKNYYTSGLEMLPIQNATADIGDGQNMRLVGLAIKPFEKQMLEDHSQAFVPQMRFVYQLHNPQNLKEPLEQFYLHVKYDVVDRNASEADRFEQHKKFLQDWDHVISLKETQNSGYEAAILNTIKMYTSKPPQALTWSSALTGIWVFGELVDAFDGTGLKANRIVRKGIDYGFYSSAFDNDILRAAIKKSTGFRKEKLQKTLESLTVTTYRDPKRLDLHQINFHKVTCAQCHQFSARDGVHMSANDFLDPRTPFRTQSSEYLFKESDEHLRIGAQFFNR